MLVVWFELEPFTYPTFGRSLIMIMQAQPGNTRHVGRICFIFPRFRESPKLLNKETALVSVQ